MVTLGQIQRSMGEFYTLHLVGNRKISGKIAGWQSEWDNEDTEDEGRETMCLQFPGWLEQLYLDEIVSMEPYKGTEPVYYEPDISLAKVS